MKKLSVEEKAKRYDEALKVLHKYDGANIMFSQSLKEEMFPELKESEDERIKRCVSDAVRKYGVEFATGTITKEKMIAWLEKQGEQKPTLPKWKYKKDNAPLLRDSIILNKYGCVAKSPSGAIVSDVWVIDYDELTKLPKEEFKKQGEQKSYASETMNEKEDFDNGFTRMMEKEQKPMPIFRVGETIIAKDGTNIIKEPFHIEKIEDDYYWDGENTILVCNQDEFEIFKQKPVDKIEPKFKVGDFVIHTNEKDIVYQVEKLFKDGTYRVVPTNADMGKAYTAATADAMRLWTIADAKDGDVLNSMRVHATIIFKGFAEDGKHILAYCALQKGIFIKQEMLWDRDFEPASEYLKNALYDAMVKAGYEWDAEKKELKKISNALEECEIENIEHGKYYYCIKDYYSGGCKRVSKGEVVQALRGMSMMALGVKANEYFIPVKCIVDVRSAWSEEDEVGLADALWCCKQASNIAKDENDMGNIWYAENWLKSLEDKIQPQPKQEWSEEDEYLCTQIEGILQECWIKNLVHFDLYKKMRNFFKSIKDRYTWKPSEEQIEALEHFIVYHNGSTNYAKDLEELRLQLKKLKG